MFELGQLRYRVLLFSAILLGVATTATAQQPNFSGLVDPSGWAQLSGKPVTINLKGKEDALTGTMGGFTPAARGSAAIKLLEISEGRRKRRVKPADIESLVIGGNPYQFMVFVPNRGLYLVNQKLRLSIATQQLASQRGKLAPQTQPNNYTTFTNQSLRFAKDAAATLGKNLSVIESENFILLTDLPESSVDSYRQAVEKIIQKLNERFDVASLGTVGPGKPIVAAFVNREYLVQFATESMDHNGVLQGHAVFADMRDRFICAAEGSRSPQHLLWETTWGLTAHYVSHAHSDHSVPAWLRIGMQSFVADQVFPRISNVRMDLQQTKMILFQIRSLEGLFDADTIQLERQVICKQLVSSLVKASSQGFEQVFTDMKYGIPFEDALQRTYGMDTATFVTSFGGSMGLPQLTP